MGNSQGRLRKSLSKCLPGSQQHIDDGPDVLESGGPRALKYHSLASRPEAQAKLHSSFSPFVFEESSEGSTSTKAVFPCYLAGQKVRVDGSAGTVVCVESVEVGVDSISERKFTVPASCVRLGEATYSYEKVAGTSAADSADPVVDTGDMVAKRAGYGKVAEPVLRTGKKEEAEFVVKTKKDDGTKYLVLEGLKLDPELKGKRVRGILEVKTYLVQCANALREVAAGEIHPVDVDAERLLEVQRELERLEEAMTENNLKTEAKRGLVDDVEQAMLKLDGLETEKLSEEKREKRRSLLKKLEKVGADLEKMST